MSAWGGSEDHKCEKSRTVTPRFWVVTHRWVTKDRIWVNKKIKGSGRERGSGGRLTQTHLAAQRGQVVFLLWSRCNRDRAALPEQYFTKIIRISPDFLQLSDKLKDIQPYRERGKTAVDWQLNMLLPARSSLWSSGAPCPTRPVIHVAY